MTTECLITGCALYDEAHGAEVWGDLHQTGDCFVFVASMSGGTIAWTYIPPPEQGLRHIKLTGTAQTFESRGVIVFPKRLGKLSQAALRYINPLFG